MCGVVSEIYQLVEKERDCSTLCIDIFLFMPSLSSCLFEPVAHSIKSSFGFEELWLLQ